MGGGALCGLGTAGALALDQISDLHEYTRAHIPKCPSLPLSRMGEQNRRAHIPKNQEHQYCGNCEGIKYMQSIQYTHI